MDSFISLTSIQVLQASSVTVRGCADGLYLDHVKKVL